MSDRPAGGIQANREADIRRRVLDLAVSTLLVIASLPLLVVVLAGSALSLRSWPFFAQDRVGHNGVLFRFVKVRTLPRSTPAYADKYQLDHDRIPAFCRFLRVTHLDELPQLYLVLFGRMSLVGPRPEMQHLHERMPLRFAAERTSVRPGCTGLWQVSESCSGLISSAPEYDRFYLENRSLRLDLWVMLRTLLKMIRRPGSVTLQSVPRWVGLDATPGQGRPAVSTEAGLAAPANAGR